MVRIENVDYVPSAKNVGESCLHKALDPRVPKNCLLPDIQRLLKNPCSGVITFNCPKVLGRIN